MMPTDDDDQHHPNSRPSVAVIVGYWLPHSANHDFCEHNYVYTPYIAEFWNTITNLAMIIPPIYGIWDVRKQKFEKRFYICYSMLLTIGLGSWLFHMTLWYEMQLLDEIPMVFGSATFTYCIYQVIYVTFSFTRCE